VGSEIAMGHNIFFLIGRFGLPTWSVDGAKDPRGWDHQSIESRRG
jgi:hypothetical protein